MYKPVEESPERRQSLFCKKMEALTSPSQSSLTGEKRQVVFSQKMEQISPVATKKISEADEQDLMSPHNDSGDEMGEGINNIYFK